MTRTERDSYRLKLLAVADRLSREIGELEEEARQSSGGEASGSLSDIPLHPADLGNRETEERISLGLLHQEEGLLDEINAALRQLESGKFGLCETCHEPIAKTRLHAVPYTRICFACAHKRNQILAALS